MASDHQRKRSGLNARRTPRTPRPRPPSSRPLTFRFTTAPALLLLSSPGRRPVATHRRQCHRGIAPHRPATLFVSFVPRQPINQAWAWLHVDHMRTTSIPSNHRTFTSHLHIKASSSSPPPALSARAPTGSGASRQSCFSVATSTSPAPSSDLLGAGRAPQLSLRSPSAPSKRRRTPRSARSTFAGRSHPSTAPGREQVSVPPLERRGCFIP